MSDRFFATCLIVVDLIRHFTLSIQILVRRLCRPCKWKVYLDNKYVYFGSQMLLTFLMLAPTNDMISYLYSSPKYFPKFSAHQLLENILADDKDTTENWFVLNW